MHHTPSTPPEGREEPGRLNNSADAETTPPAFAVPQQAGRALVNLARVVQIQTELCLVFRSGQHAELQQSLLPMLFQSVSRLLSETESVFGEADEPQVSMTINREG